MWGYFGWSVTANGSRVLKVKSEPTYNSHTIKWAVSRGDGYFLMVQSGVLSVYALMVFKVFQKLFTTLYNYINFEILLILKMHASHVSTRVKIFFFLIIY